MQALVYCIRTVPDTDLGRRRFRLHALSDSQVAQIMVTHRLQEVGSEFLSPEQHRIIAICVLLRSADTLSVCSLGEPQSPEKTLIDLFQAAIEADCSLVSWNGSGFDLPVLRYRSLLHGIPAAHVWQADEDRMREDAQRSRQLDLCDALSPPHGPAASLDEVATLLHLPARQHMEVWETYQRGGLMDIRAGCETEALVLYLLHLRCELVRGRIDAATHASEEQRLRALLRDSGADHLRNFEAAWPAR